MRYLILKIGRRSFLALQNLRGYLSVFLFHWLSKSAKVTFRGCEVHWRECWHANWYLFKGSITVVNGMVEHF